MKSIVSYLFILLFAITGCATMTHITSQSGTIKIGMTKTEVLATWGEPESKNVLGEEYVQGICLGTDNRWEIWDYPRINWWGAHTIEISFNKEGILTDIEPLYK